MRNSKVTHDKCSAPDKASVVGEKVVTPSSIVQIAFQCRYVYPTTPSTTAGLAVSEKPKLALPNGDSHSENGDATQAESVTEVEDAVPSIDTEKVSEKVSNDEKVADLKEAILDKVVARKGKAVEKRVFPPNGYAHAPRWPFVSPTLSLVCVSLIRPTQLRKPHFQVLLGDSKLDKVIVHPTRITDIPLPRPDGLPSEPRGFTLQFQAPPQANLYSFVLYASSDTFLGADVDRPIMVSWFEVFCSAVVKAC